MYRIDTHHHILPKIYIEALAKIGITTAGGIPFPDWDQNKMIEFMDKYRIKTAITSLSSPGIYFGDTKFAVNLARKCNEFSAELVNKHTKRIGAFATLPLPDIESALVEIEYNLDVLKLDGIILLSNYKEYYLGHEQFKSIFAELNRRKAIVFIHPTEPVNYSNKLMGLPPSMIEFGCDTTRAVADLVFSGRLEACPDIKFILAHAGGTIPYIAGRMAIFEELKPSLKEKVPKGTMTYLKQLYYDTTLSTSSSALKCLLDFVPSAHILFGSDYPFVPVEGVGLEINEFDSYFQETDADRLQISHRTAESLFRLNN